MGKKQASVGSEGAKVRKQVMAKDPPKTRLSGKTRPDQRPSSSPTSTTASSGSERKGFVYSTPSGKGTPALKSPPVSGSSSHKGSKTPGHDVRVAMKEKKKNETTVRKANEKLEKEPEKDAQKRKDRKDAQKGKEKEKAASKEARKEHQESQEKTSDKKGKDMKEHSSRKEGATEPMDVEKKEERALEKEKRKATTAPGKIENKQATSEEDKREQKDKKEKKDKKSKKQKKDKDKGLEDKKQKKQKEEEEESKEDENADEHQHSEPMSKSESNTRELSRALGTDPVLTDPEFSDILAELSHRYDDHPDGDTESEEMSKADDEQDDQDQKLDSDEEMTGDQDNEEEGEEAEDLDKAGKDEEQVEENSPESSESSDVESDPDSNEPSDAGSFGDLESEDGAKPPGHAAAEIAKATAKAEAEAQGKPTAPHLWILIDTFWDVYGSLFMGVANKWKITSKLPTISFCIIKSHKYLLNPLRYNSSPRMGSVQPRDQEPKPFSSGVERSFAAWQEWFVQPLPTEWPQSEKAPRPKWICVSGWAHQTGYCSDRGNQ